MFGKFFKYIGVKSDLDKMIDSYNSSISSINEQGELIKSEIQFIKNSFGEQSEAKDINDLIKSLANDINIVNDKKNEAFDKLKDDFNIYVAKKGSYKYADKMNESLGRQREDMPQIKESDLDSFLIHFAGNSANSKVTKTKMKLSNMKPSQVDINDDKVIAGLTNNNWKDRTYIVSSDNHIIDGHHSWATGLEIEPSQEVAVYKINLPAKELIRRAKLLKITRLNDLTDDIFVKSILNGFVALSELPSYFSNYDAVIGCAAFYKITKGLPISKNEIVKGEVVEVVNAKNDFEKGSVILEDGKTLKYYFT